MSATGFGLRSDGYYYGPSKDPNAVLDYSIEWTDWLDGDTIATSTWTVPAGLTKVTDEKTAVKTTAWLSGGAAGATYTLHNRITTAGGRTQDQSFKLTVAER